MGKPGARSGSCAPAQIGVARCPCDGSLDEGAYGVLVKHLLRGLENDPRLLLAPLEERMRIHSDARRYEEAGWLRDRHDALASALEMRHLWEALNDAGLIEVETTEGRRVAIDHGILVGSPAETEAGASAVRLLTTGVPPSVQAAEEARIIWKWLTSEPIRIVASTRGLSLPLGRARRLKAAA